LATSSPFTCTVITFAGPAGTVSLVCSDCAATPVARLRAAAPTTRTRQIPEAVLGMLVSSSPPQLTRDSWSLAGAISGDDIHGPRRNRRRLSPASHREP